MALSFKKQLINYLSKRNFKSQNAFTLVELIVVVVIIGILSSIAIPSFQNASEKAKQKEASSIIASYVKAAQAYYTEYSTLARSPRDLSEYVSVNYCRHNDPKTCKSDPNAVRQLTTTRTNYIWRSPSGNYRILHSTRSSEMINFLAYPHNARSGLAVTGCYNTRTGATRVMERPGNQPGNPSYINC